MSNRSGQYSEYPQHHPHDHGRPFTRRPATQPAAAPAPATASAQSQSGYTIMHAGKQVRFGPVAFWIVVGTVTCLGVWSAATARALNEVAGEASFVVKQFSTRENRTTGSSYYFFAQRLSLEVRRPGRVITFPPKRTNHDRGERHGSNRPGAPRCRALSLVIPNWNKQQT